MLSAHEASLWSSTPCTPSTHYHLNKPQLVHSRTAESPWPRLDSLTAHEASLRYYMYVVATDYNSRTTESPWPRLDSLTAHGASLRYYMYVVAMAYTCCSF